MQVSPSSPSLASDDSRLQPFHCVIHSPTQAVSGWRREVRYTLCPHIPSCHRASPTGRIPPSPQVLLIPRSQAGSRSQVGLIRERVGRDGLQRGDARWGDPTRPSEKNGTFLHLSRETKLLEVSVIFSGQCEKHIQASAARCSPFPSGAGETLRLRTSVFQIQANSVFQQFEANLALGFQG